MRTDIHPVSDFSTALRSPAELDGCISPAPTAAASDCQTRLYILNPPLPPQSFNTILPCSPFHSLSLPENPKDQPAIGSVLVSLPVSASPKHPQEQGTISSSSSLAPVLEVPGSPSVEPKTMMTLPTSASPPIASYSLNRADLVEVEAHWELLDPLQQRFLNGVHDKVGIHPQRFSDPNYLPCSSMLILSNWPSIQRYAYCCKPNAFNRSGLCKQHEFCPYCSYLIRQNLLREYVPSFSQVSGWYFLTLSFSGSLPFDGPANAHSCLRYWDVGKHVLRHATDTRSIQGVFWREELAILNFLPLTVMPHVHAVVVADHLDGDNIKEMQDHATELLGTTGHPMVPDFEFEPITSQRSLLDRLRYTMKTMDIVRPYQNAWPRAEENHRARARDLNSELRDLVTGYPWITYQRRHVARKGLLHPNHPGYVGVPLADRDDYRELVDEVASREVEYPADEEQALAE